jgi:hypothetical protein
VTAGTPEAQALLDAWKTRQAELKEAMKTVLQPAEHMGNLTRILNGTAPTSDPTKPLSVDDQVYLLRQLESLLDDVDNARDFHTIGGWPTLLSFLTAQHPASVRSTAAWAVGTAVKNTYDYQLWTLEGLAGSSSTGEAAPTPTAVELLVAMLGDGQRDTADNFEMEKRALYALSAAMRGNIDVQEAVRQIRSPAGGVAYLDALLALAQDKHSAVPADVHRKVWASLADLLQERAFIRRELANEAEVQKAQLEQQQASGNDSSGDSEARLTDVDVEGAVRAVQEMPLLGDALVSEQWMAAAVEAGSRFAGALLASPTGESGTPTAVEPAQSVALHAALRSVVAFCKEVLVDAPLLFQRASDAGNVSAGWQRGLLVLIRTVTSDFERSSGTYEALVTAGDELAALLGLWDQGANSAVF